MVEGDIETTLRAVVQATAPLYAIRALCELEIARIEAALAMLRLGVLLAQQHDDEPRRNGRRRPRNGRRRK